MDTLRQALEDRRRHSHRLPEKGRQLEPLQQVRDPRTRYTRHQDAVNLLILARPCIRIPKKFFSIKGGLGRSQKQA